MHSYWDNFFALRGFKDAAFLAAELGHAEDRARLEQIRDEFQEELAASVAAAMEKHRIDYIPGCADLGDFDPTSTTIALSPAGAEAILPRRALERTFEIYDDFFRERREGAPWEAFTPYEVRNIGAFVRLGWRDRAHELLDFFMQHRRPAGWNQWAEVVGSDPRAPRFIGDMPHTWVGSDFVRSVLDLFVYERESDQSLIVGAGIPFPWIQEEPGVVIRDLPTRHGLLSCTMRMDGGTIDMQIEEGLRIPPGGIVVHPPLDETPRSASVNGFLTPFDPDGGIAVQELPARIVLQP
jgi:hypothetical protein